MYLSYEAPTPDRLRRMEAREIGLAILPLVSNDLLTHGGSREPQWIARGICEDVYHSDLSLLNHIMEGIQSLVAGLFLVPDPTSHDRYRLSRDGQKRAKQIVDGGSYTTGTATASIAEPSEKRTVFVVHGRDREFRNAMADFLRSIGLQPLEWEQAVALTRKSSPYIGEVLVAAFSVAQAVLVLLTPDNEARLRPGLWNLEEPSDETQPRFHPRQNVLYEAGMAFGLAADRTILVIAGNVLVASDVLGRNYLRFDGSAPSRHALVERLRNAGCTVTTGGSDWLNSGAFPKYDDLALETMTSPGSAGNRAIHSAVVENHHETHAIDRGRSKAPSRIARVAVKITVSDVNGVPLDQAAVVAVSDEGVPSPPRRSGQWGVVRLEVPASQYTILVAHEDYPGAVTPRDLFEDMEFPIVMSEKGSAGSVLGLDGRATVPGLHTELHVTEDSIGRRNIWALRPDGSINNGAGQPLEFLENEEFTVKDFEGNLFRVRVPFLRARTSLIAYLLA